MGKLYVRSLCVFFGGLCILSLMRMSRAEELPMDFISVMKNDKNLCEMPKLLSNSSLIKVCRKTDYLTEVHDDDDDTFTCLAVYDTWYRLCSDSSHWYNRFNNTETFNAYIDKFTLTGKDGDKEELCKNIQKIKPVYEKIKEQVLPFFNYLNDTEHCKNYCFLFDKLNPVCALLSQLKYSDKESSRVEPSSPQNIQSNNKLISGELKINISQTPTSTKKIEETIVQAIDTEKTKPNQANVIPINTQHNSVEVAATNKKQSSKTENKEAQLPKVSQNLKGKEQNERMKSLQNSKPEQNSVSQKDESTNIGAPPAASNTKPGEQNSNPSQVLHNGLNNDDNQLNNAALNNRAQLNLQSAVEDIKTSTLSENTQEHMDVAAGHDYSSLDKDPLDPDDADQPMDPSDQNQNMPEPSEQRDALPRYHSIRPEEESHFFTYFMVVSLFCVGGYAVYHNKQKILAMVVEGRRSRNNRGRRRPSTASYRKLDCTLEEAVTSQCNANVTHVIY